MFHVKQAVDETPKTVVRVINFDVSRETSMSNTPCAAYTLVMDDSEVAYGIQSTKRNEQKAVQ